MMKLNKKLLISAMALALAVPAVGVMPRQPQSIVQAARAAKTGKLELAAAPSTANIPLANRHGKALQGKSLKGGATVKFYGQPVIVNLRYPRDMFTPFQIKGKDYISLGDGAYVKTSVTGGSDKIGKLKIIKSGYIYNKKGQRLRTYRGKKAVVRKNTYVNYGGKRYYTIPRTYFNLGKGQYLSEQYVAKMNGKPLLTLNTNTYLYNRKGRRIGRSKLLQAGVVTTNSKVRTANDKDQYYFYQSRNEKDNAKLTFVTKRIKGQQYLSIGKGAYIKIANVQTANGMLLFTKGPITVTNEGTEVYNSNFKKIKNIKPGKKVTLDKVKIDYSLSDPQLYFRIKGTNHLIYWGDDGEYPGGFRTADFDADYNDPYNFWFKQFMEEN